MGSRLLVLFIFMWALAPAAASTIVPNGFIGNQKQWAMFEAERRHEALARALTSMTRLPQSKSCRIVASISRVVQDSGADPFKVASLIVVESRGNWRAVSPVGALGLMQIMPGTGRAIATVLGESWSGPVDLLDMDRNIRYGTWYYYNLEERFQGDPIVALAAYNWGPGNIQARLDRQEKLPRVYPELVMSAEEELRRVYRQYHSDVFWRGPDRDHALSDLGNRTDRHPCSS